MGKASRAKRTAKSEQNTVTGPDRKTQVIVFGLVGLLAVGIITSAVLLRPKPEAPIAAAPDSSAPAPSGVLPGDSPYAYGFVNGEYVDGKPTLAIWEDFQCPGCRGYEERMGGELQAIAAEGIANVVYRPTTFLDRNLRNDASTRATAAWGCAIDAGKGIEYHDAIYANQPEMEGVGYSATDIASFADQAGITGADRAAFDTCVADNTYVSWAANSTQEFYTAAVPGTPYLTLNGASLSNETISDGVLLREAIKKAESGAPVTSEPETPVSTP